MTILLFPSASLKTVLIHYRNKHNKCCFLTVSDRATKLTITDECSGVAPAISVIFKFQSILYAPFDENKAFYIVKSIIILSISVYDFPREGFCFICCTSLIADIVSLFGISLVTSLE